MKLQNLGYGMYIGGIIYYNVYSIYFNSKKELTDYRKNKIYFNDEMESVVYGCQKNWYHNLLYSFFWPITLPFKMIPIIIYSMNDGKTKEEINELELVNKKKKIVKVLGKLEDSEKINNKSSMTDIFPESCKYSSLYIRLKTDNKEQEEHDEIDSDNEESKEENIQEKNKESKEENIQEKNKENKEENIQKKNEEKEDKVENDSTFNFEDEEGKNFGTFNFSVNNPQFNFS